MTNTCPTVKIKADNEQGFIVINAADFDEAVHQTFDEDAKEEAAKAPKAKAKS